ncbi:MAG: DoxX family membrane protein, partial [Bradymonadaceae bacterium]
AGTNHMLRHEVIVGRLEAAPMSWLATAVGPPDLLVTAAGVGLLVGGLALLSGLMTRWAAVGLIAITLTVQVGSIKTLGPLFKNIGLMGGLSYFATHGARAWSLDELMQTDR